MTELDAIAVIDALGDAFGAGNVDGVLDLFASDGDVMYVGSEVGEAAVGHGPLRTLLTQLFSRNERYSWQCDTVHIIACAAGYAVASDATLSVTPVADTAKEPVPRPATEKVPYSVSGLLERRSGKWRWRYCHGAEPASASPS